MTFSTLHKIREDARRLIDDAFLKGERERFGASEIEPYLEEVPEQIKLTALDEAVDECIGEIDALSPRLDVIAAPRIHRSLPFTGRMASDPGIWRFLAVVHRPDFVRHRWEFATRATTLPRYWQLGTRPNSNAFARLWWIAELSVSDGDYSRTYRLLERPTLSTGIFVRSFSHYRPAVYACADGLATASGVVIEATLRRLHTVLSTVVLEGMSVDELAELVAHIRRDVEELGGM